MESRSICVPYADFICAIGPWVSLDGSPVRLPIDPNSSIRRQTNASDEGRYSGDIGFHAVYRGVVGCFLTAIVNGFTAFSDANKKT
ncbi:hypothetical protein D3C76_1608280 [compost metagenome]